MRFGLKPILMATVSLSAFRCSWYFHQFARTGEAITEQPGEAIAIGARGP